MSDQPLATAAEVAALRRELAVVKQELAAMQTTSSSAATSAQPAGEERLTTAGPVARRELLRGAGVAAAAAGGVALGVLANAAPADAATGGSLNIGITNSPTSPVDVTSLLGAMTLFAAIPASTAGGILNATNTSAAVGSAGVVASAAGGHAVDAVSSAGAYAAIRGHSTSGTTGAGAGVEAGSSNGPALLITSPGWAGAPTLGTWHAGAIVRSRDGGNDDVGSLWYCTQSGTPGTWQQLGGPTAAGAFHILPSTIRVWDSRPTFPPLSVPKGPLADGNTDVIDCTLGGAVPVGATAVMVNLTITGTSANGFLAAFKNGIAWPGNSSINWSSAGLTTANLAVVALDSAARFALKANLGCSTDFVVDVIGYYR